MVIKEERLQTEEYHRGHTPIWISIDGALHAQDLHYCML